MWLSKRKIITKKSLKLYLNLSWFKLYTISPKKNWQFILADTYSPWRHLQAAILKGHLGLSARLKTSSLNFPFSWLVFVIGFNNKLYNLLFFHFHVFNLIFIKIMAKNKELIFLAQGTHQYIINAISLSWLVLVIRFNNNNNNNNNNNSINTVSSFHIFAFLCDFHQKSQKTRNCNFQHRVPIMECCWRTSASGCCKSWRDSCGHRS